MIIIDLDPLMTNMTVFRLSVTQCAVKITEITEILTFQCQLYLIHGFVDCSCSYSDVLWKAIVNILFSQKIRETLNDVITAVFVVFKRGTLMSIYVSSFFVGFASNLHIVIFNLFLCMGLQISILGLYLLYNMAAEKNGKPLKTKFEKIEKQNVDFC